jgi:phage/plasmid-like protein (TIGR03299 family)
VKDGTIDVKRGDAVKSYVLVAHGHDGSMSIRAGFTSVRVVCQNTLSMAMGQDANKLIKIRHTSGVKDAMEKARESLDMQRCELKKTAESYRELARRGCNEKNLVRYVREVLKPGAADTDATVRNQDEITALFESGRGAELSRGTLWGAFNAVTEYGSHMRGRSADARQNANWFGDGTKLMDRALDVAMQFAADAPLIEQSRMAYSNHASAKAELDHLLTKPAPEAPAAAPGSDLLGSLLKKPHRSQAEVEAAE